MHLHVSPHSTQRAIDLFILPAGRPRHLSPQTSRYFFRPRESRCRHALETPRREPGVTGPLLLTSVFSPAATVAPLHVALRLDEGAFERAVARLNAHGVPFGNDPEDTRNGRTDDPLGGLGRLYFVSPDGHLLELGA